MLRIFAAAAAVAVLSAGWTAGASAATIMPDPGAPASGAVAAFDGVGTAAFELDNPGSVTVTDVTTTGTALLSLTGTGAPVSTSPISDDVTDLATSAFAGTVDLTAGSYTFTLVSDGATLANFSVSEVPLPAGVVLLGTAVAGLAGYRRMTGARA
jgi:hypothetical protein